MDKESAENLANRIIEVFDSYALLPSDMTANDRNNLKNAKVELVAFLEEKL